MGQVQAGHLIFFPWPFLGPSIFSAGVCCRKTPKMYFCRLWESSLAQRVWSGYARKTLWWKKTLSVSSFLEGGDWHSILFGAGVGSIVNKNKNKIGGWGSEIISLGVHSHWETVMWWNKMKVPSAVKPFERWVPVEQCLDMGGFQLNTAAVCNRPQHKQIGGGVRTTTPCYFSKSV